MRKLLNEFAVINYFSEITYVGELNKCLVNMSVATDIDDYIDANVILKNAGDINIAACAEELIEKKTVKVYDTGENFINFLNYELPKEFVTSEKLDDDVKYYRCYTELLKMSVIFELHYKTICKKIIENKKYGIGADTVYDMNYTRQNEFTLRNLILLQNKLKRFIAVASDDKSYYSHGFIGLLIEHGYFEKPYEIVTNCITIDGLTSDEQRIMHLKSEFDKLSAKKSVTLYCCTNLNQIFTCELLELCKNGSVITLNEKGKYIIKS